MESSDSLDVESDIQMAEFLTLNNKDMKIIGNKDDWKELSIFLLVNNVTDAVDNAICEFRYNTRGMIRRVETQDNIERLMSANRNREAVVITDCHHEQLTSLIISNLSEQGFIIGIRKVH